MTRPRLSLARIYPSSQCITVHCTPRIQHRRSDRKLLAIALIVLIFILFQQHAVHARSALYPATSLNNSSFFHANLSRILPNATELAAGVALSSQVLRTEHGPDLVNQLDVDLTNPDIHLGVVAAYNRLISPDEALSSMTNRSGALVGINGDYFEAGGPGRPIGMLEIGGQLLQSPVSYAVLGVTTTGSVTIGVPSFYGSVSNGSTSHPLTSVNIYNDAGRGGLVLITPALGGAISVSGDAVVLLQPLGNDSYTVRSVSSISTWLPALSGQYALIGGGSSKQWLTTNLHPGDQVHVSQHIVSAAPLEAAIGGGPIIVKHGAIYSDPHPPAPGILGSLEPTTAVGVTADGKHVIFAIFDGRGAGPIKSVGITCTDVAQYMLAQGAYNVMLFDMGGSTEMVARLDGRQTATIVNWPSDGSERRIADGLFVYHS
jgi:hypothetical protein